MDWIFDNLQIIAIVAAGIATILSRARQARQEREIEENMPPPIEVDPDEQLRRIREEVMRRRAEREGQPPVLPVDEPHPPLLQDDVPQDPEQRRAPETPVFRPEAAPATPPPIPVQRDREEEVLERQRILSEKLQELRRAREAATGAAKAFALGGTPSRTGKSASLTGAGLPFSPTALAADLRNPSELRRAIVLTQVLGRPKGA